MNDLDYHLGIPFDTASTMSLNPFSVFFKSLPFYLSVTLLSLTSAAIAETNFVETSIVRIELIEYKIRTFGILSPNVEELSFAISGRIEEFTVEDGDDVLKDQLLAKLDTQEAEDALKNAKNQLDNSDRKMNRMMKLHKAGSIQVNQLENAQAQFDRDLLDFERATANHDRCFLYAPSNGVLLKQYIDSRTNIKAGEPLFIFQSDSEKWVTKVELTDRNAIRMAKGAAAKVTFLPYPNEEFTGVVSKVARIANKSDSLYTTEVVIATDGRGLRPGMVAEVDLYTMSDRPFAVVPMDALLDLRGNRGRIYLLSADGSHAVEKAVTIESINGEDVAIVENLSFNRVITHGHHNLTDQSPVSVRH